MALWNRDWRAAACGRDMEPGVLDEYAGNKMLRAESRKVPYPETPPYQLLYVFFGFSVVIVPLLANRKERKEHIDVSEAISQDSCVDRYHSPERRECSLPRMPGIRVHSCFQMPSLW